MGRGFNLLVKQINFCGHILSSSHSSVLTRKGQPLQFLHHKHHKPPQSEGHRSKVTDKTETCPSPKGESSIVLFREVAKFKCGRDTDDNVLLLFYFCFIESALLLV